VPNGLSRHALFRNGLDLLAKPRKAVGVDVPSEAGVSATLPRRERWPSQTPAPV
jgi:hypothetical protein